uniref:Uncharacterized protein n=1 Tax=Arundo donax TaxID=35708 RepID=A0A0A9NQ41_ARUDO
MGLVALAGLDRERFGSIGCGGSPPRPRCISDQRWCQINFPIDEVPPALLVSPQPTPARHCS